jgi:tetratricopeptide (TPR) repeat protein
MRSKFTNSIIGSVFLILLTPTSIKAQARGDIGTNRQPQTCPSRLEPRTGIISAAQAIKYATCEAEADRIVKRSGRTDFIDIFSLQVNPKPRRAEYLDINYFGNAIANSPVYEIKGTAVAYSCAALDNRAGGGRPGKNCLNTHPDDKNSVGVCFREPSGNWRCRLSVGGGKGLQYGPPPGNNANASGSSNAQTAPNENADTYHSQTKIKWKKKDYQGALADITRAIQIEPNNAHFYNDRGRMKSKLNDRSGARKDWQQAAKLYQQQGNTGGYEDMLWLIKKYDSNTPLPNAPN